MIIRLVLESDFILLRKWKIRKIFLYYFKGACVADSVLVIVYCLLNKAWCLVLVEQYFDANPLSYNEKNNDVLIQYLTSR